MKLLLKTNGMTKKKCIVKDLKLIGFFNVLKNLTPLEVYSISDICEQYQIKSDELKQLLLLLKSNNLISYSANTTDIAITIEVSFIENVKISNEFCKIFGIKENVFDSLISKSTNNNNIDVEELKVNTLILLKKDDYQKYEFSGLIDTKEQLILYLKNVCVQELFAEHQVYFSSKDAEVIFDSVVEFQLCPEVVSILVDYTLKTTKNKNFNHNFYLKIANNFSKNKVENIMQGLDHINKFKENVQSRGSGYVEPTFEKPQELKNDPNFDLEELIENAYN